MSLRFRVYVRKKPFVFDPEEDIIKRSIVRLGFSDIGLLRVGRFFDIELNIDDKQKAYSAVKRIADELLTNPVVEENIIEEIG